MQTVGKPAAPTITAAGTPGGSGAAQGTSVGQVTAPASTTVQTINGKSYTVDYLTNDPATQIVGDITPASLLANLPASLQPGNVPFYYDPYAEDQQIEQAALQQTGKDSFYATSSANSGATDSTSQASIENQDKAALYGASIAYAEQNNIALGTQLSQAQLALINQPMLWYVQQTVPEPGCTATGGAACPTEQALVPEVLLPANYASVSADGEITGTNVTLDYANSILNTGTVTAQNLTINTGSLTDQTRSTNVGTIYQEVDGGVEKTTGTVVQQGGVISATNYDVNAQAINDAGTIQQLDANGSFNAAGTAQTLADFKAQLGSSFTQSTPTNDLNTTLIADQSGIDPMQVFAMVVAVVAACLAQPEISAAIASASGAGEAAADAAFMAAQEGLTGAAITGAASAAGGTLAVGGLANTMIAVGLASFGSSALSNVIVSGSVNLGEDLRNGVIGAVTAGLTNGITYDSNSGLGFDANAPVQGASAQSLSSLSGAQSVGTALVPQAGASAAGSLGEQAAALAAQATVQAGVQTALGSGGFLTNLKNDGVADAAAAGAFAIGQANANGDFGTGTAGELEYVAAHAALGCAAGAASGTGCVSSAIGGAVSAALSPDVIKAIDPSGAPLNSGQSAAVTAMAMLAAAGVSGGLGQDPLGAATAAENEALNNSTADPSHVANAAQNGGFFTALSTFLTAPSQVGNAMVNGVGQWLGMIGNTASPQNPAGDPNAISGASNQPPTASGGVMVVPQACPEPGACGVTTILIPGAGSAPSNAILSSGNNTNDAGSGADAQGSATNTAVSQADLDTLAANGVKFTPQNVLATGTTPSGQTVFLETGSPSSGLQHIIDEHANDFANIGVPESQISNVVMQAVTEGNVVGYQGAGTGRPIYQIAINGQSQRIAITVGSNGYIVGANPAGSGK